VLVDAELDYAELLSRGGEGGASRRGEGGKHLPLTGYGVATR
jgi:hypothetical protein